MVVSRPAEFEVKRFHIGLSDDLAELLRSDASASSCWCMWFIDPVKDFHAAGSEGNRARFEALARAASEPMGLLAYSDGKAVGWCAVGPKERFARAMRTPTLRGYVTPEKTTWFVPCFYVHPGHRRRGVTKLLLERAVSLAAEHGAELVAGFPTFGSRPASSGDRQVGSEGVFANQGFVAVRRPSGNRVVMQRAVGGTADEP
jgi:GNAT superfamily N-acetyltransferase